MPPSIPTSFVPHTAPRRPLDSRTTGAFGLVAYIIFGLVCAFAIGVFFYDRLLAVTQASREKALVKEEAAIDAATVESFVRLRNRLDSGRTLLAEHVAFSNFFSSFSNILPTNVRFTTLRISFDTKGNAKVEGAGIAKSFNALSVSSGAFADEGRIKDVIFSKITVNRNGSISFGFSATIDPRLLTFAPGAASAIVPTTSNL